MEGAKQRRAGWAGAGTAGSGVSLISQIQTTITTALYKKGLNLFPPYLKPKFILNTINYGTSQVLSYLYHLTNIEGIAILIEKQ